MGFLVVLIYVSLYLLSPADMFPQLAPYRILLVLAVLTIPLSVIPLLKSQVFINLRTQLLLVVAFFLFAMASWIPHGWFGGALNALDSLLPNVIVYFLGIIHFRGLVRLKLLRIALVLVALYILGSALSQVPEARATGVETPYVMVGLQEPRIRGLGLLHDPNYFGQYLLILLPMLFVTTKPKGMGLGYLLAVPVALVFLFGIYMTNSRGTALGCVLLIALYLTQRFKRVGLVLSGIVGVGVLAAINLTRARTISISGGIDRLAIWSDGLGYFKSSPLWGIGYYAFVGRQGMTAHNSYLLCAAELGLIGYFLWMSIMLVTIIQLWQAAKLPSTEPPWARWATALRMSLIIYLFTGFFLSRTYDLPLFLLLGLAGAVIDASGGENKLLSHNTRWWPAWALGLCIGFLMMTYIMVRLRAV
jgi:putative inorganic carbon (HCO3(-)) transporter